MRTSVRDGSPRAALGVGAKPIRSSTVLREEWTGAGRQEGLHHKIARQARKGVDDSRVETRV